MIKEKKLNESEGTRPSAGQSGLNLRAGEWVEVRSKDEILRTLDRNGRLDELPFMPQMFEYCGQRLKVHKRAHKTCDTVNDYKGRRMDRAVHLDGIRCDGQAYGGCQAACLIFWKEDWLRRAPEPLSPERISPAHQAQTGTSANTGCKEEEVWAGTKASASEGSVDPVYICQATQVPAATSPLAWWDVRQYVEDLTSRNAGLGRMTCGFVYMAYNRLTTAGIGLGRSLRWLYDLFQRFSGGIPYPRRRGKIPAGAKTPNVNLDLQPGEWVRVKSYAEILQSLDTNNKNRGLYFDAEMVPFCGRNFRVLKRVRRILDEKTGKMTEFKNPCIMLEGVVCEARYSECRLFCPRAIYSYWREAWLERIAESDRGLASPAPASAAVRTTLERSAAPK